LLLSTSMTRVQPARSPASRSAGVTSGTIGGSGNAGAHGPGTGGPAAGLSRRITTSQPICASQKAVIAARPPSSSASTIRAPRTGPNQSVSCTSWPPGAGRNPARCPAWYSSGERTSKQ